MPFQFQGPIDAGCPFVEGRTSNDYSCFHVLNDLKGIYVFEGDGEVLYVGECHRVSATHRGLKARISHNYTRANTGGNFRINYCKEHCSNLNCKEKSCDNANEQSFVDFIGLLNSSRILAFVATGNDTKKEEIKALEYALICLLRPKYNKEILRERTVGLARVWMEVERVCAALGNRPRQLD